MQPIVEWLEGLGLGQYAGAFSEAHIGRDVLCDLSEGELEKLGIALGDRKRILRAIAALRDTAAPLPTASVAPARVSASEAERRQISVMFCDLVGSTALSSRLDPEDLREVIGKYHAAVAATVARFDGFVAKYMGDGVLVYFGYPHAHEDDAEQAARAGLALVDAVSELDAPECLQVRIGIATGLVVAGDLIGAGSAQEQAIVGETPNLAARLQALAEPGSVVISAGTRRLLGRLFDYCDLGLVRFKGFADPVAAFRVLCRSAEESRFEARQESGVAASLVGREEELELLLRRWRQVQAGEGGRVVLLTGEPGIGKSRIARALQDRLADEPHVRVRYFCSPHHQDSALNPFIAQLQFAARFAREDTPAAKQDKLESLLAQSSATDEEIALIADLLSLPTDGRYCLPDMSPPRRKDKTLQALLVQSERLSAQRPVLMVFEDAHWIDPTSLELLTLCVERKGLPVLLLITARPEFTPPWPVPAHATTIALTRLDRREGAALVQQVASGKVIPAEVLEQVLARTDGVPLFLEELTKAILESGLLREETERFVLTGLVPALAIPTTLHDSLMARLDRHSPVREVAQIGAALGRTFSYELIRAVAPVDEHTLNKALAKLVEAELLYQRGVSPNATYLFKHALIQETAYQSMLISRRRQLHQRIAHVLAQRFPEIEETQPEILGHHYTEAGLIAEAATAWHRAGQLAVRRSGNSEAIGHFTRALALLSKLPDSLERRRTELDLQTALGPPLSATKGYASPEVERVFIRARELCREVGEPRQLSAVLWGLYAFYLLRAEMEASRELAEQLQGLAERADDSGLLLAADRALGTTFFFLGEFARARVHLERGAVSYEREKHRPLAFFYGQDLGVTCRDLGSHVLWYLGYPDQALNRTREALALARKLAHAFSLSHALDFAAWLHHYLGEALLTEDQADAHVAHATEQGIALFLAHGKMLRGWVLVKQGRTNEGLAEINAGLAAYRGTGAELERPYWLGLLAYASAQNGRPEDGLSALTEAIAQVERTGVRFCEAELHRLKGELLLRRNIPDEREAESCLRQALEVAQRQSAKSLELRAAVSLSRLLCQQGRREDARGLLAPIYNWFTEGFDAPDLIEAKALLQGLGVSAD